MLPGDESKLNKIEELKSKLFNRNYRPPVPRHDSFPHFLDKEVADSWREKDAGLDFKEKLFLKTSMFKKFFIFSIVFFVFALGYASYVFFADNNTVSNDNIDILVKGNTFTPGGEEYPLSFEIVNRNNTVLDLVDLVLEYPKGSQASLSSDSEHLRVSLGTIPAGGIKNESLKLVLFGERGSTRQIKISLEYRVEGSNAIFVKEEFHEVTINSTPLNLSVDAPLEVTSGQEIGLNIKAASNATKSVSKILLEVGYPIGFQFIKATPAPSFGSNIWNLGDLAPGTERNVSILGKMVDVFDGEEKVFRVWGGPQSPTGKSLIGVFFSSGEHTMLVKKPSIEVKLSINGVSQREYAVNSKTSVQGQVYWRNNLETKINNLAIRAKISGNAVNRRTITSERGFYDSLRDLIIWDKNGESELAEVAPGDYGTVSFSLSPLPLFGATSGIIVSPVINIDISATGEQALSGGTVELSNKESKAIKIISDVGLSTKAFYYSGPFTNTGPIPPKAEQNTTYTITWSLSNTANNISKGEVHTTIPAWIRFTGLSAPGAEDLSYNSATREIIWSVGSIGKGTGITGAAREVSFQVEFTPSLSQVGTLPILVNETVLTGHDDFANVDVRVEKVPLDIRLLNDLSFPVGGGRVTE